MIATVDELVAALASSTRQSLPLRKGSLSAGIAYGITSLWRAPGVPGLGAIPVDINGELCTSATAGALRLLEPAGGGVAQHIARLAMTSSAVGQVVIYDRIWHGLVDLTTTAVQPIDWPTVGQRYSDGAGVELYAEILSPLGSTASATWTAEITDQDGHPALATAQYGHSGALGRMIPFSADDSQGVQSVESIQLSATQPSGQLALVLVRRLAEVAISAAGVGVVSSGLDLGLPVVEEGACLGIMVAQGEGTESGTIFGRLEVVEG